MLTYSEIQSFKQQLKSKWHPTTEKCGTISDTGEVIDCVNLARDPENFFEFSLEDLEGVSATWHTHPSPSSNLSIDDYRFFQSWPNQLHFIISSEQVWCYQVAEGLVYLVEDEEDYSAWPSG